MKKSEEIMHFLNKFIILCQTMLDEISKLREHAEWAKSNGWGLPIMMEDDMEAAEKAIMDLAETCNRLKGTAMDECCCCETNDYPHQTGGDAIT